MKLVDPVSNIPFAMPPLKMPPFLARFLARIAVRQGRAAARRADWGQALDAYGRALRLAPKNARIWVQTGHAYGNLNMPEAAQHAYRNATVAQPDDPIGHHHLGYVHHQTHLHDQGIRSLARALLLDPDNRDIAGILRAEKGEEGCQECLVQAALAHADECRPARTMGWRATWLRSRARKAARARDWKDAEKLFTAVAQLEPNDPDVFLQLGHALNHQNRQPEAELAYRRAIACDPLYVDPWLHLGYVLTAQNHHGTARKAFAMVLRLAPDRLATHPILAGAQIVHAQPSPDPVEPQSESMKCPPELAEREKAIWNLLAAHIQGKH